MRRGAALVNEWMTTKRHRRQADSCITFPWLTVETTLWGLLLAIALGIRLLRLDAALLNAVEARDALASWRFAHGQVMPDTTGYSPMLFAGQWFMFLIVGANEWTARLLPALAGTTLVLTPILLRRRLGRLGALAAGILLALSPTAVILSRTASGDVFVALGALLCTAGLGPYLTSPKNNPAASAASSSVDVPPNGREARNTPGASADTKAGHRVARTVYLVPLGIALMLVSSPLAYSALAALGSSLLLTARFDSESRNSLRRAWAALRETPNLGSYLLATLVGAFVLLSTAFAWHFEGLAAAADLLPQWLAGFVRWSGSLSFSYPGLILVFYEPFILFLGAIGVALAAIRGNSSALFLALWSIIALLLALIRPGHSPGDILLVLAPMAYLAGSACATLLEDLRRWGNWSAEGLYFLVAMLLWAYLAINLATYTSQPAEHFNLHLVLADISLPTFFAMVIATSLLLIATAVGIGFMHGTGAALRGIGLSTSAALLLFTIATAWRVSQIGPADPRELLVLKPTATEMRLLTESLSRISSERHGHAHAIDLGTMSDDPALAWVLRDFQTTQVTDVADALSLGSAVIAPHTLGAPSLGQDFAGQVFPLQRSWQIGGLACRWNPILSEYRELRQLDCSALVDWLLFRRTRERPAEEQVVLWLRKDLASAR